MGTNCRVTVDVAVAAALATIAAAWPARADDPSPEAAAATAAPAEAAPAEAAPGEAGPPDDPLADVSLPEWPVRIERLGNGLVVAIEQDRSRPRVAVAMGYAMGSADDPEGYRGLCHLTEHLMFQGSRHVAEDRLYRELERAGVTGMNGLTMVDDTLYYAVVPANRLETVLWLESDRLGFLLDHLEPATLDIQKRVVQSEYRLRGADYGTRKIEDAVFAALYPPGHPYRLHEERLDDIGAIGLDHARWFFQRHYAPANATLAIVGDVEPEATLALVRRWFDDLRPSPVAVRAAASPPSAPPDALPGAARLAARARVLHDRVEHFWRTPRFMTAEDAALDVAAEVIEDLLDDAFEEAGLRPRGVYAVQRSRERGSYFHLVVRGNLVEPLERFAEVTERVLAEWQERPEPGADALARARRALLRSWFGASESLEARARFLARHARRRPLAGNAIAHELARYRAVDAEDVAAVVRDHLGPRHRITVLTTADEDAGDGGDLDGWTGLRWDR